MLSLFLEEEEIKGLTKKVRKPAQRRALNAMGIEHKVRPDNSIVVLRAHIEKVFDGVSMKPKTKASSTPNWGAI